MERPQGLRSISNILESLQAKVDALDPPKKKVFGLNVDFVQSTIRIKQKRTEQLLDKIKISFLDSIGQKFEMLEVSQLPHIILLAVEFIEEHAGDIARICGTELSSELKAQTCVSLVSCVYEDLDLEQVFETICMIVGILNKTKPEAVPEKSGLFRRATIKKSMVVKKP